MACKLYLDKSVIKCNMASVRGEDLDAKKRIGRFSNSPVEKNKGLHQGMDIRNQKEEIMAIKYIVKVQLIGFTICLDDLCMKVEIQIRLKF